MASNAAPSSAKSDGRHAFGSLAPVRAASDYSDREFARTTIEEARRNVAEDDRHVRPWVAAVAVKDESLLAMAHGGEVPRSHSEYVAEMKLVHTFVPGATFRTLLKYE